MAYKPANPNGQATMANSDPVVIASDQSAVPVSASALPLPSGAATETTLGTRLSESDFDTKVGALTETAPATDTASSGLNGRLQRIAQRITSFIALIPAALTGSGNFKVAVQEALPAGTANIGDVDVLTLPALPAGTNNIGDVDVLTLPALPTGSNVIGALTANQSVNVAQINGVTALMGNGVTGTGSQRVTIASDNTAFSVNATLGAETTKVIGTINIAASQSVGLSTGSNAIGKLAANSGVDIGDVDVTSLPALAAGTNNIGDVDVLTLPALVTGSAIIGKVGIDQTTPGTTNLVALAANQSVNSAQVSGTAIDVNSGNKSSGTQRVVIATDQPAFAVTAASTLAAETTKVIGTVNIASSQTVGIVAGSAIIGKTGIDQTTPGTTNLVALSAETTKVIGTINIASAQTVGLAAGSAAIGKLTANSGVIIGDVNIAASQTIGLATGSNAIGKLTSNSGVVIGDVNISASQSIAIAPATSGGLTTYHLASAGTTNATVVKNTPGQVFGWFIYNSNAAARKLVFHNASSTPTAGASVFFSLMIPATSGANVMSDIGIPFSTGISITTVTGLADSDSAAVAANDLIINIFYK